MSAKLSISPALDGASAFFEETTPPAVNSARGPWLDDVGSATARGRRRDAARRRAADDARRRDAAVVRKVRASRFVAE